MSDRLVIIASTYRAAFNYARDHDLGHPGERWMYVYELLQVAGGRGGKYVVVVVDGGQLSDSQCAALQYLKVHGYQEVA